MIIYAWEHFRSVRLMLTFVALAIMACQVSATRLIMIGPNERRVNARSRRARWDSIETNIIDQPPRAVLVRTIRTRPGDSANYPPGATTEDRTLRRYEHLKAH